MHEMGTENLGSARTVGAMDMKRVARWLNDTSITPLQRQGRLAGYSAMCAISRTSWKRLCLLKLADVRREVRGTKHKLKITLREIT